MPAERAACLAVPCLCPRWYVVLGSGPYRAACSAGRALVDAPAPGFAVAHAQRPAPPHPVLQAERQRIARDLHDQVGSQLVSAIALLDPATPSQKLALSALEQCLLDLRLVVDSMDSSDESLPDRLARLRHRIQPVLQHRGIVLAWEVDCTPHEHLPSGDQAAHLAHIVQEALSNMLQHSGATRVHIRLAHLPHEQAWHLEVTDNGIGLPSAPGQGTAGQGLTSMLARAQLADCQLQLLRNSHQGGTCIRIVLACASCCTGNASQQLN